MNHSQGHLPRPAHSRVAPDSALANGDLTNTWIVTLIGLLIIMVVFRMCVVFIDRAAQDRRNNVWRPMDDDDY
jgi:hypothetical protein